MAFTYEDIEKFMRAYFPAYSYDGQHAETQSVMDNFYAEDITFDDGFLNGRDKWYKICLSHPTWLDVITPKRLCIDVEHLWCSAEVVAAYTLADGSKIAETGMNAFYTLAPDAEGKLKIKNITVYLESNAEKINKMFDIMHNVH